MKKITAVFLIFLISIQAVPPVLAQRDIQSVITDTADYLRKTVTNPTVGSVGGEWAVLGLARSGEAVPEAYFDRYYSNLCACVSERGGVLHDKKYTEYSRVVLALTAMGKNPADVAGYDLVLPLSDFEKCTRQGINGAVWALIALDSGNYGDGEIRRKYVNYILENEKTGGGWALSKAEESADADVTAMVLTALSNYTDGKEAGAAAERAVSVLSKMQKNSGGFESGGEENSESTAQVLTALCTLGIAPDDPRFVKNQSTLVGNLLSYYREGNGFLHTDEPNLMATEQCFYALTAADRFDKGMTALFDMSDTKPAENHGGQGLPGKSPDVGVSGSIYPGKTFDDIPMHENRSEIEALAQRGIINGMTADRFCPDNTMTRAEFAAIAVKALGLPLRGDKIFDDVSETDWFYAYVSTAYTYGIVNGVSRSTFNPQGTITKEEAAAMTARAAEKCGLVGETEGSAARDVLALFDDYVTLSDWAVSPVAFCYDAGILDKNDMLINPKAEVTRGEIAKMLYNMLGRALLI